MLHAGGSQDIKQMEREYSGNTGSLGVGRKEAEKPARGRRFNRAREARVTQRAPRGQWHWPGLQRRMARTNPASRPGAARGPLARPPLFGSRRGRGRSLSAAAARAPPPPPLFFLLLLHLRAFQRRRGRSAPTGGGTNHFFDCGERERTRLFLFLPPPLPRVRQTLSSLGFPYFRRRGDGSRAVCLTADARRVPAGPPEPPLLPGAVVAARWREEAARPCFPRRAAGRGQRGW